MQLKPKTEKKQFAINRVASWYDFAKVLEHCVGGPQIAKLVNSHFKSGPFHVQKSWLKLNRHEKSQVLCAATPLLMFDPALYLGYPDINQGEIRAYEKIAKGIGGEEKLYKSAEDFHKSINRPAKEIAKEIQEMNLFELSAYIEELMSSEKTVRREQLRWSSFLAIATDPKITRINHLLSLKYQDPDEVITDFPNLETIHNAMTEEIESLNCGWEHELELDVEAAQRAIIRYRAENVLGIEYDESVFAEQVILDLGEEIGLFSGRLEGLISENQELQAKAETQAAEKKGLERELKETIYEKKLLEEEVKRYERHFEKMEQPKEIKSPEQKTLEHAISKAEALEGENKKLKSKIEESVKHITMAEAKLEASENTIKQYRKLCEILELKKAVTDYYSGKRIALVTRFDGSLAGYDEAFKDFGVDVSFVDPRKEESGASSYDFFILTTDFAAHEDSAKLPRDRMIYLPGKGTSKIPESLLAALPLKKP